MKKAEDIIPVKERILNLLWCMLRYPDPTVSHTYMYYFLGWTEILPEENLFQNIVASLRYQNNIEPHFVIEFIKEELKALNVPENEYLDQIKNFQMLT